VNWTAVFVVSFCVFLRSGRALCWARLLWLITAFLIMVGVYEHSVRHVIWLGHIPSFLKIEDETVRRILTPQLREYTGRYRTQATFGTSLGYAEYLSLSLPFILHFVTSRYAYATRVAAVLTIGMLFYVVTLTDARLGVIGCLLALLGYGFFWGLNRRRVNPHSIAGPAIAFLYPFVVLAVLSSSFASHRMHAAVWGNDATQEASTHVRYEQFALGVPKLISQPWGYGGGMAGETLNYRTPGGLLTIDSYYLAIALEYGVLGFILYYAMFLIAIYISGRCYFSSKEWSEDGYLLGPLMLSLVTFCVIKSVFSEDDNHPLAFMMLGMVLALVHRQENGSPHKFLATHSGGEKVFQNLRSADLRRE
jgi:hypothetical protein